MSAMGLDLSISGTGVATGHGRLYTIAPKTRGDLRLAEIERHLIYYLDMETRPDVVVIEAIPTASKGFHTALSLAMVHGIARKELARRGIPFVYIDNKALKKYASGSGAADKQRMVECAMDFGAVPANDNEADAAWLRWIGEHWLGRPVSAMHVLAADLIMGARSKVMWPDRSALRAPDRATR